MWKWKKKFRRMFFQFGERVEGFSVEKAVSLTPVDSYERLKTGL